MVERAMAQAKRWITRMVDLEVYNPRENHPSGPGKQETVCEDDRGPHLWSWFNRPAEDDLGRPLEVAHSVLPLS